MLRRTMPVRSHRLVPMAVALAALAAAVATGCGRPAPAVSKQVFVDGPAGRLLVDDGGTGPDVPVVLVHSLAGNRGQWTPQLTHLRRTRRTVALDLRGHGRSAAPSDRRYAPGDYAADVLRVMDACGIGRAIVVGHSLGGGVAIAVAGSAPERVAGLFFVDPIDDPSKRPVDEAAETFLRRLEGPEYSTVIEAYWHEILKESGDQVRRQVLADLRATPKETVVGSMRGMAGFSAEAALANYRGPMVTLTTPMNEFPSSLHRVVSRIRQEKMTGVSHWLHLDRPDEFNASLDRFLAGVSG
jgi:pimeloyl-ACP methyl ester carboxylesterase